MCIALTGAYPESASRLTIHCSQLFVGTLPTKIHPVRDSTPTYVLGTSVCKGGYTYYSPRYMRLSRGAPVFVGTIQLNQITPQAEEAPLI